MKQTAKFFSVAFVISFLISTSFAFDGNSEKLNLKESITKLRALYFQQDFEAGVSEGQKLVQTFGGSNELRAWLILNQTRSGENNEAVEAAEKLTKDFPNDAWSWFALAGALNWSKERGKEALDAVEKAFSKNSSRDDFIWLRAEVLRRQDKKDEALAFIEENLPKVTNRAELLVSKAIALYAQSRSNQTDQTKRNLAFDTFEAARKTDASCVNAYYFPAFYLMTEKKYEEAHSLLKYAVQIAPATLSIHTSYWQATTGLATLSPDKKRLEIEEDMTRLLKAREPNEETLFAIKTRYAMLNVKDKKNEFEERLLKRFPNSERAEFVLDERMRNFYNENQKRMRDPLVQEQYRQMLRSFIKRPQHHNKVILGNAYLSLFMNMRNDKSVTNEELFSIVKGMAENQKLNPQVSFIEGPLALANRNVNLTEAEQFARKGPDAIKKSFENNRSFYKTEKDFDEAVNEATAASYDTIGWILFKTKRYKEAETELLRAHELDPLNDDNLYHLGQLYEAIEKFDKAEEFYTKGWATQLSDKNPAREALKALYRKRNEGMEGFEAHEADLREKEKVQRKARVLRERIAEPQPPVPFNLKSIDGKETSLARLAGKVVVINFWGIWCSWCIKEMPDLQKLQEKYAKDSDVLILTINNDGDLAKVQQWMKENKYGFSVLLENDYNKQAEIRSYPTTWFIDKQGRIAYLKRGYTKELVDEFSWRIEDLKTDK
jgi:thiol-disulfide isomerase/thioredoxin